MKKIIIPGDFGHGDDMYWRMTRLGRMSVLIHAPIRLMNPEREGETVIAADRRLWVRSALGWYRRLKAAGNA